MQQGFEQLFSKLSPKEPPRDLFASIMAGIDRKKKLKKLQCHLAVFSIGSAISLVAVIPASLSAWKALATSGFIDFVSLIFSDFSVISVYWQNYALSLLETLPALELALSLSIMLIFLEFMKYLARDLSALHKLKLT